MGTWSCGQSGPRDAKLSCPRWQTRRGGWYQLQSTPTRQLHRLLVPTVPTRLADERTEICAQDRPARSHPERCNCSALRNPGVKGKRCRCGHASWLINKAWSNHHMTLRIAVVTSPCDLIARTSFEFLRGVPFATCFQPLTTRLESAGLSALAPQIWRSDDIAA